MAKRKRSRQPPVKPRTHKPLARPHFRPRVVVKLRDFVEVAYRDGAEKEIVERYGPEPWERLQRELGRMTLKPLYTSVSANALRALVKKASERDPTYRAPNLLTWFTVDCPPGVSAEALCERLLQWELVQSAHVDGPGMDPVAPADDTRWPSQGYLDPAPDGIDAEYAWTIPGGDGVGQNVIDLEQGWTLDHEDLVAHGGSLLFGTLVDTSRYHGTAVFGEICAVDNDRGCVGIVPEVASMNAVSYAGVLSNIPDAIVAAITTLGFGDVLLLEVQTFGGGLVSGAPVEILDDCFDAIRMATALGVIVVEAAGNGTVNLDTYNSPTAGLILDPTSADFRDSGAIIVGAASSAAPHTRLGFSSFGARVNCYGWGENVDTCSSNNAGSTTIYTGTFGGTSSASPIVTGAALAVQGVAEAGLGYRIGPAEMRAILTDPATSTPSQTPATDLIGVMPDLRAIIEDTLVVGHDDLYLRDHPGDTGDAHAGSISSSPDIIVRPDEVLDPQTMYGEGSGTENSSTLGYEAEGGQDNFIYARVRNRGPVDATGAAVTVYWSEVGTLITPDLWNLVGQVTLPSVPAGNVLTVSDAIVWPEAEIPATGHYCFVGLVETADDPAPTLAELMNFDVFRSFIRNNNNVTWRNFNVVENVPDPDSGDPAVMLPFNIGGAPDRAIAMGFELDARLPKGARLRLRAPRFLLEGLKLERLEKAEGDWAVVPLNPHRRQRLGELQLPRGFRARLRLEVELPEEARKYSGYEISMRQYVAKDGDEVGRVGWYLAAPEFFERRKELEQCLQRYGRKPPTPKDTGRRRGRRKAARR
jgi:serine protease